MRCYYAQTVSVACDANLPLPPQQRLFLISPPVSPCEGWTQVEEDPPVINQELMERLACMAAQDADRHELHPMSTHHPAIIVHPVGDSNEPLAPTIIAEEEDIDPIPFRHSAFPKTPRPPGMPV